MVDTVHGSFESSRSLRHRHHRRPLSRVSFVLLPERLDSNVRIVVFEQSCIIVAPLLNKYGAVTRAMGAAQMKRIQCQKAELYLLL